MKQMYMIVYLLFVSLLFGCSNAPTQNSSDGIQDLTGYVVKMENQKILVTEESGNGAAYYTITDKTEITGDMQIGKKVTVWVTGPMMESYPTQASADKIEVVEDGESKYKAIQAAIVAAGENYYWIHSLKMVEGIWQIELVDKLSDGAQNPKKVFVDSTSNKVIKVE